jgi:Phosphotransferase enzyme family
VTRDTGMDRPMKFPQSLDEITVKWLSAAVSERYSGLTVKALSRGAVIRGMATKAQLHLEYQGGQSGQDLPSSLWVKCGFDVHSENLMCMFETEAKFFRDLAPLLPVNIPKSYLEVFDPGSRNALLLLEDLTLREVTFGRQTEPLEPEVMLRVLALQADYHGALWKSPRLKELGWLTVGGGHVEGNVLDTFLGFWDVAEQQPRFTYVPPVLRDRQLIRQAILRMQDVDARQACCVVHGDAHQSNLFFSPNGEPGYLDWASVMLGHWAFDVAYLIVGSQTVENRRRYQRDQLRSYLHRLGENGATPPSFEEAWLAYRQHAIWMFMTTLCPVELQPEELCMHNAERACAAIVDLDALSSLGF